MRNQKNSTNALVFAKKLKKSSKFFIRKKNEAYFFVEM